MATGVPLVTARLRTSAEPSDPTKTLYGTVYTVTDSISRTDESAFVWTICPRIEHRVRAHLSSGVPELTARLRTHLPQSVQIQAYLRTGVPEITARVRTASGRVQVHLATGVPEITARLRVDTPDPARIQVHLASGVPELTALLRTLAATPHCQMFMFTLDEVEAFGGEVQWAFTNVRIDSELVVGGVDAYLGVMLLSSSVVFNVAAVRDDLGGGSGPQMVEPWTRNREAIRLTNGSNTVTIPGPNSPLASSVDPSEPYRWTLEPEAAVPYDAFRAAFDENLPTTVRLCDYSLPDARIRAHLSTGVPEVTARVRTTTLVASRIRAHLATGVPAVTARLRVATPGETRIRAHLATGIPVVSPRLRVATPADTRMRAHLATGVPLVTTRLRVATPIEVRIRANLRAGIPVVAARLRTTTATPQPGKTLYGTVYTVTDSTDRSDASAFIWTICPAIRIQAHLRTGPGGPGGNRAPAGGDQVPGEARIRAHLAAGVPVVATRLRTAMPNVTRIVVRLQTGVPEVAARLRVATPTTPPLDDAVTDDAQRAAAGTVRRRRTSSSSLPPDDEQLFPLAAKLGQIANFEAAWFLGRPAFLEDVSVPRSFELVPNRGGADEVNVNKGRALPPPAHEEADYLV